MMKPLCMWILVLAGAVSLTGCATLEKEECLTARWYDIGYEDGARGFQTNRVAKHRKACSKHGVVPDLQQYQAGRAEGLKEYCTAYNGYQIGLKGRSHHDVCRGDIRNAFLHGYNTGLDIYSFERKINLEKKELDRIKKRLEQIETSISQMESSLSKKCSSTDKCRQSLDEIRGLDRQKNELRLELDQKQIQIDEMRRTLADTKSRVRF